MQNKHQERVQANIIWKYIDIFSYHIHGIGNIYEEIIGREYKREEKKFDYIKTKNILHIGCGSYPITALTLANNNHRKIVTIDRDKKSIKRAKKLIHKKKLDNIIKPMVGNGKSFSLDRFDMIIVSGCSVPKYEVVDHLFKNSKPNTKMIIRKECSNDGWFKNLLYNYNNIEVLDEMYCKAFQIFEWKSVLVKKK